MEDMDYWTFEPISTVAYGNKSWHNSYDSYIYGICSYSPLITCYL